MTLQLADLLPSAVVTVMVAVPFLTPVMVADRPLPLTLTMLLSLLLQVTFWLDAPEGLMVAFSFMLLPTFREATV